MPYPSSFTPEKQRFFRRFLGMHIPMTKGIIERYRVGTYLYIDTNAADGAGSPSIFDEEARHFGLQYQAVLIEQKPALYKALRERFGASARHGDHNRLLPECCELLRYAPYGLIYHDPFGAPSFEAIRKLNGMQATRRLDILMTFPSRIYKFIRTVHKQFKHLKDELATVDKSVWLIRKPDNGSLGWTVLYGTNYDEQRSWARESFYRYDSQIGQAIFEYCTYTEKERQEIYGQQPLPF